MITGLAQNHGFNLYNTEKRHANVYTNGSPSFPPKRSHHKDVACFFHPTAAFFDSHITQQSQSGNRLLGPTARQDSRVVLLGRHHSHRVLPHPLKKRGCLFPLTTISARLYGAVVAGGNCLRRGRTEKRIGRMG